MSDTTEHAAAATQEAVQPADDQAQDNQPQANDNQVEANDNRQDDQAQRQSREDRRIAQLSARLAAETRERERLAAEAEVWRRQLQGQQVEETDEQRALRERHAMRTEVEAELRRERFHAEGEREYGTAWRQKCDDLIAMGADPGFAALVVEMPDAVKVTSALSDDPETVQRIAGIKSERGRAIALGRYAASLERAAAAAAANDDQAQRPAPIVPRVTAAPPPVRAVSGARAAPAFDPYNPRHTPEQLFDFFAKQEMDKRTSR